MKPITRSQIEKRVDVEALSEVLALLDDSDSINAFLLDLCTPAELQAMADRWQVVPLLKQGLPYREIHQQTGVSVTTIGRVARCMNFGTGGYEAAYQKISTLKGGSDESN